MNVSAVVITILNACGTVGLIMIDVPLIVRAMQDVLMVAQSHMMAILVIHGFVKDMLWPVLLRTIQIARHVLLAMSKVVWRAVAAGFHIPARTALRPLGVTIKR